MPAEDTLKYKVELDTSDVASQIQALQDQIKIQAASDIFTGTPFPAQTMSMPGGGFSFPQDAIYNAAPQHNTFDSFQNIQQVY